MAPCPIWNALITRIPADEEPLGGSDAVYAAAAAVVQLLLLLLLLLFVCLFVFCFLLDWNFFFVVFFYLCFGCMPWFFLKYLEQN